jgi:hypothetical protein
MLMILKRFAEDDCGFVLSSELILILTIGVIGMIVGLNCLQNAIVTELADVANAIGDLNQSYSYVGWSQWGGNSGIPLLCWTKGSFFMDQLDDGDEQPTVGDSQNIIVTPPMYEGGVGP